MNCLVIGATGLTGTAFTEQALAAGHRVTAFVRSPDKLKPAGDGLDVVRGDGRDAAAVERAVLAHPYDAILIAIGGGLGDDSLNEEVTANVMQSMHKTDPAAHLWIVSAAGTGDSTEQIGWIGKLLKSTMLRKPFADHEKQEREVMNSHLPYTIVRPVGLTNGPLTPDGYVARESGKLPSSQISRADVAHYILTHLTDPAVVGKAMGLSAK